MELGKTFNNFDDLNNAVQQFSKENNSLFYIRDSKTLKSMMKVKPNRIKNANQTLKYYMIQYSCVHGGKEFKSRRNTSKMTYSMKEGCTAKLVFFLTIDKRSLQLTQINLDHNHSIINELEIDYITEQEMKGSSLSCSSGIDHLQENKKLPQTLNQNREELNTTDHNLESSVVVQRSKLMKTREIENKSSEIRDEFSIFGEHIANELRTLRNKNCHLILAQTKQKINSALYDAEIDKIHLVDLENHNYLLPAVYTINNGRIVYNSLGQY